MKTKRCSKCEMAKSRSRFYKDKRTKDELQCHCKECMNKSQRVLYRKRHPIVKRMTYEQIHRTVNGRKQKRCYACKKFKSLSEFYKSKRSKDSLTHKCKTCDRVYSQTHKIEKAERQRKRYRTIKGYLYVCYCNFDQRCNNPGDKDYKNYGKRGIKNLFKSFREFFIYVTKNLKFRTYEKIKGLAIDRIDNNKHYEKGNIQFLTPAAHRARHKEMRRR